MYSSKQSRITSSTHNMLQEYLMYHLHRRRGVSKYKGKVFGHSLSGSFIFFLSDTLFSRNLKIR